MVGVSASVNLPLHHKVQEFSSGTGSPGWSRKKGHKTVVVVVVVILAAAANTCKSVCCSRLDCLQLTSCGKDGGKHIFFTPDAIPDDLICLYPLTERRDVPSDQLSNASMQEPQ